MMICWTGIQEPGRAESLKRMTHDFHINKAGRRHNKYQVLLHYQHVTAFMYTTQIKWKVSRF